MCPGIIDLTNSAPIADWRMARIWAKNGISTNRLQRADCAARAKSVVVPAARAHARERSRNVSRNQRFHKFRTYRGLGRRGTPVQRSGCRKQNL